MLKTQFTDAVESQVPKGSASNVPAPSQSGSPISSQFSDAIEKSIPGSRTGGLLPEKQLDSSFSYSKPGPIEPGKTFTLGKK